MRPAPALAVFAALAGVVVAALLAHAPERGSAARDEGERAHAHAEVAPLRSSPDAVLPAREAVSASASSELVPAPLPAAPEPAAPPAPRASIAGRVVGGTPADLASLEVLATRLGGEGERAHSARCAPDGRFTLDALEPGARYVLFAIPAGKAAFARPRTRVVEALAGAGGIELALLPRSTLVLRVADGRTGAPLEELEVRLGSGAFLRPLLDEHGRVRQHFPGGLVRSDELIEPAAGDSFALTVAARGYRELRLEELFVPVGGTLDLGVAHLERAPRLVVHVLAGAARTPVAGALVRLRAPAVPETSGAPDAGRGFDRFQGRTDADGRVLLSSRPGEELELSVAHPVHATLTRSLLLPLGEEHVETVLLPGR